MPELPEVEVLRNQLREKLTGLTIKRIDFPHNDILISSKSKILENLNCRKITALARTGKFIGFRVEDAVLWLHLGMTGQIILNKEPIASSKHLQMMIGFDEISEKLFFYDIRKFGKVFLETDKKPKRLQQLGPDPFEIKAEEFSKKFKSRKGRIKSLLLNQHIVSGLGNIYADESLYRARIDPRKRPYRMPKENLVKLHQSICEVLGQAIREGGSSIDDFRHTNGESGRFQNSHLVYGRGNQNCLLCGAMIRRIVIAGRSTHFCAKCQH